MEAPSRTPAVPSLLRGLTKAGTKVQMSESDGNADVTMAESIISSAPRAGGPCQLLDPIQLMERITQ